MTTMSMVPTAQDGRGGEGVLGQPLRVLPLIARPRRWSWQCLEVPLCRLSEWRWAGWGRIYSDHQRFQFLLLFPLAKFITLPLRWKFPDPLLGDVAPRWTSSFLRRAHSGTIRQVRRSADIRYPRIRWSKCKLLATWHLAPLEHHFGIQYTYMWTTLGGTHSTYLGTTWASLGYNVDNNWVTTSPVRYIDMTYQLSIYRHFWKISISISISIWSYLKISISIRQFKKYRYRYGDFGKYRYRYRYR